VLGAITGAYLLSSFPGHTLTPFVAMYLMIMGIVIVLKAFRDFPPRVVTTRLTTTRVRRRLHRCRRWRGWGPIVASTLIARGNDARLTIGSVNAVEFFVTLAASVMFVLMLGLTNWYMILALALGGLSPPRSRRGRARGSRCGR
jgi:uncharacterized protein